MASSLFPNNSGNQNNVMNTLNMVKSMMNGGNAETFGKMLMGQNPQFAQFVRDFQSGQSVEQVCSKYGFDTNQLRQFLKR